MRAEAAGTRRGEAGRRRPPASVLHGENGAPLCPPEEGEVTELKSVLRQLGVLPLDGGASETRGQGRQTHGLREPGRGW